MNQNTTSLHASVVQMRELRSRKGRTLSRSRHAVSARRTTVTHIRIEICKPRSKQVRAKPRGPARAARPSGTTERHDRLETNRS